MKNTRDVGKTNVWRQRGTAAVEFALVFPFLFIVTYGAIIYSYVFVLRQALTFAAQEAAESVVNVQPGVPGYNTLVVTTAVNTINASISWMPDQVKSALTVGADDVTICSGPSAPACASLLPGDQAVVVRLELPLASGTSPLFATFTIPPFGQFPPLPTNMVAQAVARL